MSKVIMGRFEKSKEAPVINVKKIEEIEEFLRKKRDEMEISFEPNEYVEKAKKLSYEELVREVNKFDPAVHTTDADFWYFSAVLGCLENDIRYKK